MALLGYDSTAATVLPTVAGEIRSAMHPYAKNETSNRSLPALNRYGKLTCFLLPLLWKSL